MHDAARTRFDDPRPVRHSVQNMAGRAALSVRAHRSRVHASKARSAGAASRMGVIAQLSRFSLRSHRASRCIAHADRMHCVPLATRGRTAAHREQEHCCSSSRRRARRCSRPQWRPRRPRRACACARVEWLPHPAAMAASAAIQGPSRPRRWVRLVSLEGTLTRHRAVLEPVRAPSRLTSDYFPGSGRRPSTN